MADGIFFCRLHFCESAVAAFRQKHFVVSESTFSMTLCGNCSLYFSLKFNAFTAFNKCYHRAETRCAVGLSSQFTEQLVYVALRIAVLACITCGVDTRTSVKRRHLQTGVVGKAVVSVFVLNPTRFKHGVTFDCSRRFRNVVVTTYFRKTENIVLSSCNSPDFLKLVFIICSEYNILHIFLIIQLFYLLKRCFTRFISQRC